MPASKTIVTTEAFEALSSIRRDADGSFLLTFLDSADVRYLIRVSEQVARDICDELNDSLP